jgi:DNA-directed RNA polymerase specialized sigma24 family protein
MSSNGSITYWLDRLKAGDRAAVQPLWEHYFPRLVGLARQRLRGALGLDGYEEDVALSALDSFCRHARQGRFPQLLDREGLWWLLVVITQRKAFHLRRDESRQKRGGGVVMVPLPAGDEDEESLLRDMVSREPTPEEAALLAEECQRLLKALGEPENAEANCLRKVAVARMEGYTNAQIAAQLGVVERTVKRHLEAIRAIWSKKGGVS